MGRYIVMDVVFHGNSLNYDQGSGNYQELKKITKWDGRQYTLVSRYALRYSLLETAKNMGLWEIAEGDKLMFAKGKGGGAQTVIQPAENILLSGEILKYPEFDLFGYLITTTKPQNFRTAPVKISHAVSMTPFNYDALFNANLGLANRMRKKHGDMSPNPFTAEEHETFYQYSIVIDVDNIGEIEVYIEKKDASKLENIKVPDDIEGRKPEELEKVITKKYHLKRDGNHDPVKERVEKLVKAVINLKRSIKGRDEDLSPKLLVVGIYKDNPYRTYKDRITLVDEYIREEFDEIKEEPLKDGGRLYQVRHIVNKNRKPVFEIISQKGEQKEISEKEVLEFIETLFKENSKEKEISEVKIFYDPSIEVRLKSVSETQEETANE